jgi:DNA-binding transcriptional ArsR family regulator
MDRDTATTLFESLASGHRLDIFRLLVRHAPDGLVAGAVGGALGIAPTKLSFHLKALVQAGLLTFTAEGRFLRYRANLALMGELVGYLTAECCQGNAAACVELTNVACCPPAPAPAGARRVRR